MTLSMVLATGGGGPALPDSDVAATVLTASTRGIQIPEDASRRDAQGSGGGAQAVPEPAALLLVGSGLVGLAFTRRRKRPAD